MTRVEGVDPERTDKRIRTVLEAQAEKWGAPLLNHLIYARRPTIFHGARAVWGGLYASGLLEPAWAGHLGPGEVGCDQPGSSTPPPRAMSRAGGCATSQERACRTSRIGPSPKN